MAPGGTGQLHAAARVPDAQRREVRTLFVANRGEIARRIASTAATLGIATAIPRTSGAGALDLLDVRAVIGAALAADADAVHPGYGFLAESPDLAAAVLEAGMSWVGPPPAAIRALGDKAEARAIARSVGVPVATGEEPADQSDASLVAAAGRIGYPVLVKPAAGGGGKGIRVVEAPGELAEALAGARREAVRAFADDRLLLERYIEHARHVEVQVLADRHGGIVHLGDRDCSLQRRHQKLLEEAPAPALAADLRAALHEAAVRLARAVGYESAGTCEFLVAEDGSFVFLEMNARLQVEHPVTELVLGRDLVADQIRIAAGATMAELGLEQGSIDLSFAAGGHAIEVRLNAENPVGGFLPSSGRIATVAWPAGSAAFGRGGRSGIRVDAGIEPGDEIGGRFDPLLAKVIAHGPTRQDALDSLAAALDATEVLGLVTNLRFLRRLVRQPVVREARLRVDTLDGDPAASPVSAALEPVAIPDAAWIAAAARLVGRLGEPAGAAGAAAAAASGSGAPGSDRSESGASAGATGPWAGGWRVNLPSRVRLVVDGDAGTEVRTTELRTAGPGAPEPPVPQRGAPGAGAVEPGAGAVEPGAGAVEPGAVEATPNARPLAIARDGDTVHVSVDGRSIAFRLAPPPGLDGASARGGRHDIEPSDTMVSPMPGVVLGVHVAAGAAVAAGARIATLEAMKMEHVIRAPRTGWIEAVLVRPGDQVERGRVVARLGVER